MVNDPVLNPVQIICGSCVPEPFPVCWIYPVCLDWPKSGLNDLDKFWQVPTV